MRQSLGRVIILAVDPDESSAEDELAVHSRRSMADLWRLSGENRRWAAGQVIIAFTEGVLESAILTLFARLALNAVDSEPDSVFVPGLGESSVRFSILLLLGLICVRFCAAMLNTFFSNRIQFALVRRLRHEALTAYSESSWQAQSDLDDGAVQQLIVTLPNGISSQLSSFITYVGQIGIMIAMLSYSMLTDTRLTALLISVIVLSTLAFRPLRSLIKRSSSGVLAQQRELSSGVAELTAVRFETQTFGLVRTASKTLHRRVDAEASSSERLGRLKGAVVPLFTAVTYLATTAAILVLLSTRASNLARTGPILLVVLRSLSYGTAVQQVVAALANIGPSLELLRERLSALRDNRIEWGDTPFESFGSCRLDTVSFAYPKAQTPALLNGSLEIARGSRVGLVGPSGSGKSTIVRLLLGLVEPDCGCVEINGTPLHQFRRESWGRAVGVVPQEPHILAATVADNLRFFRDDISDDDLWSALQIADMASDVALLPEGLDTRLGPGQRTLSGGQQQRLAIARAFAGRPQFVVMDEPTSSVDAVSEGAISDAIERIPGDITLVIVSHRLRILEDCDQIVVVENSRITHVGKPEDLLPQSEYLRSITPT